jgi:hypothetical protein
LNHDYTSKINRVNWVQTLVLLRECFWLIVILERIEDEIENRAEWIG